jgi:hypothetical protein
MRPLRIAVVACALLALGGRARAHCPPGEVGCCTDRKDCDDENPCTEDVCNALGACDHLPLTLARCDDGLFCNGEDTCVLGVCVHAGDPCAAGAECANVCNEKDDVCRAPRGTACADDGNVCTDDFCNGSGSCVHRANTRACDDGLFCNGADACSAKRCIVHAGDPCAGGGECADRCDEVADSCVAPAGAPCRDEGDACSFDRCDGAGRCLHLPGAVPCDDGVFCNGVERCVAGRCAPGSPPCAGGPECRDVCNEEARDCLAPAGAPCGDDGFACTADVCEGGSCAHVPVDTRCDSGECELRSCQPDHAAADPAGCVATPVGEGEPCTDDGFACTDDTCTDGACLHVPIASRCVPPGECTAAACAPEQAGADPAGCLAGPALAEGRECAEDGEPCTDDECLGGQCGHEPVDALATCEPVRKAFRRALALHGQAQRLLAGVDRAIVASTTAAPGGGRERLVDPLSRVAADLEAGVRTLAGKSELPAEPSAPAGLTPAQARARAALEQVRLAPRGVRRFLRAVGVAARRGDLGRDSPAALRRGGRLLLRGLSALARELRRLQRVSQSFVP